MTLRGALKWIKPKQIEDAFSSRRENSLPWRALDTRSTNSILIDIIVCKTSTFELVDDISNAKD